MSELSGNTDPISVAAQVRILRGHPDDVELAALVAGPASTPIEDDEPVLAATDPWADRSRLLHGASAPRHADAWRWSLRS